MKKSFLALALMSAFSGAAFAQSSVTIYGIADVGFQSLDLGNGRMSRIQSGQEAGSRLGFKGVEDLGGGLKASFVLEQGIQMDTGASDQGRTFGRTSVVGLSGDFGSLNLGRDKTTTLKFFDNFDPFVSALINNGTGIRAAYFVGGTANPAADTTGRVSNAVFYGTPNLSGFTALVSYGFGEAAGDTSANRSIGLNLGYKVDALEVGYNFAKDNAVVGSTVNAVKANTVAASYDFGVAKPVFFYQKQSNDTSSIDKKIYSLAVTVPVDATGKVLAGFTKVKDSANTAADSKQFALGYSYALSKRTDLYTSYARTTQDAASKFLGSVAGSNVTEFTAGVRHQF
ncbi:porin [Undibacterium griseum]|uniref:Porin n=1 Tax=Undibacterium griseum TaxID=2762295 RepID=A0ABR6YNC4_9BURK|nr:porin [Undibacterium griseum]MBC3885395.1 porin [Undibacterium griseum]